MSAPQSATLESGPVNASSGKPWGFWATLGISLVILIVWIVIQVIVTVLYLVFAHPSSDGASLKLPGGTTLPSLEDGTLLSLSTLAAGILMPPVCMLCAALKSGISVKSYLGLRGAPLRQMLSWLGLTVLLCAASDGLTWSLGRQVIPDFMLHTYRTVAFEPLLWIAFIAGAPLFEEFFFRGFLFEGIRASRLGSVGAVLLTTAAWASLHIQYDLFQISILFVVGLALGYARIRTNSLAVPLMMHAVNNLLATLEAAVFVHFLS